VTRAADIETLTAREIAVGYTTRTLGPVEVTRHLLERIEDLDPAVDAFCHLDPDETLRQASASQVRHDAGEPLGPLDGVPVAIKDVFDTSGWPTRKGSLLTSPDPVAGDAPAVARLRATGAVFIGKTTTPDFGWKGLTDSPLTGITRNPWDLDTTPGGSSGGSAAALAAGMAPLALGTDGGGSIRIPGSFTGTVGLKPTFGRVPYAPMSPFGTLAHAGPMARTVEDCRLLYEVIASYDPRDWTALPDIPTSNDPAEGVAGLRVMYSPAMGFATVDAEVAGLVEGAVDVLRSLGAVVERVDPGIPDPTEIWKTLWNAGAAAVVERLSQDRLTEVDPGLLELATEGRRLSALDYVEASNARSEVAVALQRVLVDYDLLVTPTMPITAFGAGLEVPPGWPHRRWHTWSPFSLPFNLSQQPAMTGPCGVTDEGLPVGLQIVAAKHRDGLVFRAAAAYEAVRTDRRFTLPVMA
jgi:aspartyl-tRNA(Asn)/glutamyl-tRNA(Gln) amidotransferase subunit A